MGAKPAGMPNPLQDVKRALIGHMLDSGDKELHISPSAAGSVLLAPDDWDLNISQDRSGIHVYLVDKASEEASFDMDPAPIPGAVSFD